jgi:6-pyruvoyltetrahydropterin/6-carboxytetrahydropterin synthase
VTVEGPVDEETGLVMDFAEMKKIFLEEVDSKLDHKLLNDIMENPSAENLVIWIWKALEKKMPISKITVYENENSFAEYEG